MISVDIEKTWQSSFWGVVSDFESGRNIKEAALEQRLLVWTRELTSVVVETSHRLGWEASAKGHLGKSLPIQRNEYLSLDVVAFPRDEGAWKFPVAVFELENSQRLDLIGYAFWKLLCVRADLRIVFCYRKLPSEAWTVCKFLEEEILSCMSERVRNSLDGTTIVVVGSKNEGSTFPYGFFKWWRLENNTLSLKVM